VRTDSRACLLCEPALGAGEPFALARDHSGGAGSAIDGAYASGLIPAPTSDLSWVAGLIAAAAAVLAFATRHNLLWLLAAGGALGFAGVIGGKSLRSFRDSLQVSQTNGREARLWGERDR
jgi:hypothetical protein